jgi:septum site-determining protein MinC
MATAQDPLQPVQPEPQADAESEKLPASLTALIDELDSARTGEPRNGANGNHAVPAHAADAGSDPGTEAGADAGLDREADEARSAMDDLALLKIRGRPGGVAIEIGSGDWELVLKALHARLQLGDSFFRGGRVVLEVGDRLLVEEQLRQLCRVLEAHTMSLLVVHATAERTLQAVAEIGAATSLEEGEPPASAEKGTPTGAPRLPAKSEVAPPSYAPESYAPEPYASLEEPAAARPVHFVHRGNLRSGQVLRKTESIVIIGDVNPGAQVISGGDIMVWGRLRGVAHAGADGNRKAVVTAIDFVPTQLRIANSTAIAPDKKKGRGLKFWQKEPERRPEIARVVDGRIVVEPWDEFKPKSLGTWRK